MSGTVSTSGTAGPRAGAAVTADAGAARDSAGWRRARCRVVAAAAVAAGVIGAVGRIAGSGTGGSTYHTSTATVTRRSLTSQTQVDATLGDAGSYSVVNQAQGTITELAAGPGGPPGPGAVPGHRQPGGAAVRASAGLAGPVRGDGRPGCGRAERRPGPARLCDRGGAGPASGWDYFSAETADAVEALQAKLGVTQTGTLAPGPGGVPADRGADHRPGTDAVPGGAAVPGRWC